MITIINKQRKIKIDEDEIKKTAQKILDALNYPDYDLGILFTTNKTIQNYNQEYRGKDKPTDILSFSYHPHLKAGQRIKPKTEEDKNLGDLIISPEYVYQDTKKFDISFQERVKLLLVHGICHLLGYDHEQDEDYKKMQRKEKQLLKIIS